MATIIFVSNFENKKNVIIFSSARAKKFGPIFGLRKVFLGARKRTPHMVGGVCGSQAAPPSQSSLAGCPCSTPTHPSIVGSTQQPLPCLMCPTTCPRLPTCDHATQPTASPHHCAPSCLTPLCTPVHYHPLHDPPLLNMRENSSNSINNKN